VGRRRCGLRVTALGVVGQDVGAGPALGGEPLRPGAQDAHPAHDECGHDGHGHADGDGPRDEADRDGVERGCRRCQLSLLVDRLHRRRIQVRSQRFTNKHTVADISGTGKTTLGRRSKSHRPRYHQGRRYRGSRVSGCSPNFWGGGPVLPHNFVDVTD